MKLLIAIVNNDDAYRVNTNLIKMGFVATKIASTGGFLMNGNSTFLIGIKDEDVEQVTDIIAHYSKKRVVPTPTDPVYNPASAGALPAEVTVGGAHIFVMDVESYKRV
ncbi:MAG: transcriptional regulator [Ruminococcaceae bacterium]|nr:transcriptional regulator [Oscillospiraceae bacterium]